MSKKKLAAVTSLFDLENKASRDKEYEALAISAARNLGGDSNTLQEAMHWLRLTVMETGGEDGVIEEVNFCR